MFMFSHLNDMTSIRKIHSKFVQDLFEASKLMPNNSYSIIPSIFFLIFIFPLLYSQFHRYTNSFTGWRTKLYKDMVFHWTYFYTSRIWFMFLKVCKWILQYTDRKIEMNSSSDEVYFNKVLTHFSIFMLALSISLIPCMILFVRYLHQRQMPDFLMWVAEDPWRSSEIGTSGHYLERPPRSDIYCPYKHNASYRSRRSSSVDTDVFLQKDNSFIRSCKSATSLKKSGEQLNC